MYIEIYRYLHPLGIYAPTYVEVYLYFLNEFIENSSTFSSTSGGVKSTPVLTTYLTLPSQLELR